VDALLLGLGIGLAAGMAPQCRQPARRRTLAGVPIEPGLCGSCSHVRANTTRRGTTYLRCTRAEWDERLVRYPRLPVLRCAGHQPHPRDEEIGAIHAGQ
jgi:hypothetical protein